MPRESRRNRSGGKSGVPRSRSAPRNVGEDTYRIYPQDLRHYLLPADDRSRSRSVAERHAHHHARTGSRTHTFQHHQREAWGQGTWHDAQGGRRTSNPAHTAAGWNPPAEGWRPAESRGYSSGMQQSAYSSNSGVRQTTYSGTSSAQQQLCSGAAGQRQSIFSGASGVQQPTYSGSFGTQQPTCDGVQQHTTIYDGTTGLQQHATYDGTPGLQQHITHESSSGVQRGAYYGSSGMQYQRHRTSEIVLEGGARIIRPPDSPRPREQIVTTHVHQHKQQYAHMPLLGSVHQSHTTGLQGAVHSSTPSASTVAEHQYSHTQQLTPGGQDIRRVSAADVEHLRRSTPSYADTKRYTTAPVCPPVATGPPRYAFELSREIGKSELTEEHYVLRENVVHHEMLVPRRRMTESSVNRTMVQPEKVLVEEIVEDIILVKERIIDIKKPVVVEKIVEVPGVEYVEKITEVPEIVVKENVVEVPGAVEYREKVVNVPKIVYQERLVEIPEIEYREIPVETIVEVPEVREQISVKRVPVPQYVDKIVETLVDVPVEQVMERVFPRPVEATMYVQLKLPQIRSHYVAEKFPLFIPRFVEVPISADGMDAEIRLQYEQMAHDVAMLAVESNKAAVTLCDVESVGADAVQTETSFFKQLAAAGAPPNQRSNELGAQWKFRPSW